jgi:hypothetical protein
MVQAPVGLLRYDDLPRRLLRLGHVAAIMLPLINVIVGVWLDRLRLPRRVRWLVSVFLLAGAVSLPLALGAEAFFPAARALRVSALPAVVFCSGVFVASVGAIRTPVERFRGSAA